VIVSYDEQRRYAHFLGARGPLPEYTLDLQPKITTRCAVNRSRALAGIPGDTQLARARPTPALG
jgi:hypothetical protein